MHIVKYGQHIVFLLSIAWYHSDTIWEVACWILHYILLGNCRTSWLIDQLLILKVKLIGIVGTCCSLTVHYLLEHLVLLRNSKLLIRCLCRCHNDLSPTGIAPASLLVDVDVRVHTWASYGLLSSDLTILLRHIMSNRIDLKVCILLIWNFNQTLFVDEWEHAVFHSWLYQIDNVLAHFQLEQNFVDFCVIANASESCNGLECKISDFFLGIVE